MKFVYAWCVGGVGSTGHFGIKHFSTPKLKTQCAPMLRTGKFPHWIEYTKLYNIIYYVYHTENDGLT